MNIEALKNKTILLFGKSRAFSSQEFDAQMRYHKIEVLKDYDDKIALVVEGKMMTPYEQNRSDELYELTRGTEGKNIEFVSIDLLENELAKHIDADTLLMSLKLSHDKERLKGFIKNSTISDELFFRLLKLYSWSGEDFFENDDNRDVTAALIGRFYENIERNHNVQYATLGLMHLIKQSENEKLIEAIATLEPLVNSFKSESKDANYAIVTSIAKHDFTPKSVLKLLVKKSNSYIKMLIALRDDCDALMQKNLYESDEEIILEALSHNKNLDNEILKELLKHEKYAKNIAINIDLMDDVFNILLEQHPVELTQNSSLNYDMQDKLLALDMEDVKVELSSNTNIDEKIILKLLSEKNQKINLSLYANSATSKEILEEAHKEIANHAALSCNESTPSHILLSLANSSDAEVLHSLAKNISTPVEVLYQLQLDSRFERAVKENPAFGQHIQSENIGWLV